LTIPVFPDQKSPQSGQRSSERVGSIKDNTSVLNALKVKYWTFPVRVRKWNRPDYM